MLAALEIRRCFFSSLILILSVAKSADLVRDQKWTFYPFGLDAGDLEAYREGWSIDQGSSHCLEVAFILKEGVV